MKYTVAFVTADREHGFSAGLDLEAAVTAAKAYLLLGYRKVTISQDSE